MWNIKTIENLSRLQKRLILGAFEILKPGGILVYSTCTHAPEENEEVIDFITDKFKGNIKIETINLPVKCRPGITGWKNSRYSSELKKTCRIYPHDNNTEGFFIAKIRKTR
jgi:16S rRNA C967 or C1407 C5-methylase (RsmB/RsmF family)